ncbi:MAG: hypothetical protein ABIB93_07520, partial [Chloroflexota bacterium]
EFTTTATRIPEIISTVEEEVKRLDTVVALGVAVRCDSKGEDPVRNQLVTMGYNAWRAKINMGLGRHTNPTSAMKEKV